MTATMLAVRQRRPGGPEVLEVVEAQRPRPDPTEVLVAVRPAGVNPVDWVTRAGKGHLQTLPFTLGWEVSGVVEEIGVGVTRFAPGDDVFGMPRLPKEAGAYAEYLTAPSRQLALKPPSLSHVEAGGLSLAGLTAWQILSDTAHVAAGQRVLVTAAAGGVGHLAVQIAKARGAFVIATARSAKHRFLEDLGADEVLDYTSVDVAATVRDVDVVLDAIGGDHSVALLRVLRPGGLIVPVRGGATSEIAKAGTARGVTARTLLVEPDGAGLEHLAALVDAGQLRVEVEQALPLADAAEAHRLGEAGRTRGKMVLTAS
ncbi:MAG: NADP-dependent oxidoreductase [Acidimicrobiales bacterium]